MFRLSFSLLCTLSLIACNGSDDSGDDSTDDTDTDTGVVDDAPTITTDATAEGPSGASLDITVTLEDEDVDTVTLDVVADNTTLFPEGSLVITGDGTDRIITASPAANEIGEATLTLTATDDGGNSAESLVGIDIYVNRTFGGVEFMGGETNSDRLHSVGSDALGNLYTCGYMYNGGYSFAVLGKSDLTGTPVWSKLHDAPRGNIGRECSVTADGKVAFATQLKPSPTGNQQITGLYTYTSDGTLVIDKTYLAGGSESYGQSAVTSADGSVYQLSLTSSNTVMLFKFDDAGIEQWSKTVVAGLSSVRATHLIIDNDGSIWAAGYGDGALTDSEGSAHTADGVDGWLAVYDATGALSSFDTISTPEDDSIAGLTQDSDGSIYVTGATSGVLGDALVSSRDWWVQKRTVSHEVLWTVQSGELSGTNASQSIAVGHDGTVYITGYADYISASDSKMHITALNPSDGAVIYSEIMGAASAYTFGSDITYSGRDLIIAGVSNGSLGSASPTFGVDAFIMVVDPVDGSIRP